MYSDITFGSIILSLIITIIIYSSPIIIYRYAIRKSPLEKNKAKKVTIIYAIFSFIIMSFLIFAITGSAASGGGILLWSYVNYRMLIGGGDISNDKTIDTVALNKINNILNDNGKESANYSKIEQENNLENISNDFLQEDIYTNSENNVDIFEKTIVLNKKYGELTKEEKEIIYMKNLNKEYSNWINKDINQMSIKDIRTGYFLFKFFKNTNSYEEAENISKKLLYIDEKYSHLLPNILNNDNINLYDNSEQSKKILNLKEGFQTKICQKCGSQLPFDSIFCNKCGTELKIIPETKFCRKCGTRLIEDSLFCNKCGNKIKEN